jgi:deazaflavin-dependent oxidoreductase (nitroreductase family)
VSESAGAGTKSAAGGAAPDGGAPRPARATPERLSRRERIGLLLHRELDRRLSPLGVWVFRGTKGGVAKPWKVDALLLTTRGRRSGRERTVVLQYFRDDPAMVVIAANDGGTTHPAWFLNLVAEPAARVEVDGRSIPVRAEVLPPDEAAAWWPRILARSPEYERYARATDRAFPVVRLVPASTG